MKTTNNQLPATGHWRAFTLIELLAVIAIIGVLAAFTIPVLKAAKTAQYRRVARGELEAIETALENYKAKYGVYPPSNKNSAAPDYNPPLLSQLYYELSGTVRDGDYFVTLDGSSRIKAEDVKTAYGVDGFINCSRGSGEDAETARNFIANLRPNQFELRFKGFITNNLVGTTMLLTSIGGPDDNYKPLSASGLNPFRYVYPGTNNPASYDLWVQLVIGGKTNLICNWSKQVQINNPLP